jgi:hypothetical protein
MTVPLVMPTADEVFESDEMALVPTNGNGTMTATAPKTETAFSVAAPEFLAWARTYVPPPALVEGFIPGDGTVLIHGHPRTFKSWVLTELAVCIATGVPAFGTLPVKRGPVLYVTNEDSPFRVAQRVAAVLAGHGITADPPDLHFMVHTIPSLDDMDGRDQVEAEVRRWGCKTVMLDTLRTLTACVDKGPNEFQPLGMWMRHLVTSTGVVCISSHHDAKPPQRDDDKRSRSQRVSGGGIFSASDAPIHMERTGESACATATPNKWKFSESPAALSITLTVNAEGTEARMDAVLAGTAPEVDTPGVMVKAKPATELRGKVVAFLKEHPGATQNAVAQGVGGRKQSVVQELYAMLDEGVVDSVALGNATYWHLRTPS